MAQHPLVNDPKPVNIASVCNLNIQLINESLSSCVDAFLQAKKYGLEHSIIGTHIKLHGLGTKGKFIVLSHTDHTTGAEGTHHVTCLVDDTQESICTRDGRHLQIHSNIYSAKYYYCNSLKFQRNIG